MFRRLILLSVIALVLSSTGAHAASEGSGSSATNTWSNSNKTGVQNVTRLYYQFKDCPNGTKNAGHTQFRMTSARTVFNRSYGYRKTGAKFKFHWGVIGTKCNSFGTSQTQTSETRKVSWNGLSSKAYTYTAPSRFYWIVPTSASLGVPAANAQVSFKVDGQSKVTCVVVKVPATQSSGCAKKP